MRRVMNLLCLVAVATVLGRGFGQKNDSAATGSPFPRDQWNKTVERLSEKIQQSPRNVGLYSQRGTAYFFLGKFRESLADFDRMIELDPSQAASHWQRGITLYYLRDYKEAAKQFESYHSFDNIDRENGIWRFLCQAEANGVDQARQGLLKYEKDDREPFPDLYEMFAGKLTDSQVFERIEKRSHAAEEKNKQLFYADLYAGLYSLTMKDTTKALKHLERAVANQWGRQAGGGPGYMWHVARVHRDLMVEQQKTSPPKTEPNE